MATFRTYMLDYPGPVVHLFLLNSSMATLSGHTDLDGDSKCDTTAISVYRRLDK